ncbi:MAG TPA: hypothetical protein VJN90_05830 [Candidatus Acidoferrales bacterium]|nr:hypothetical protein [Candidatus Acidoferrales bacterium]
MIRRSAQCFVGLAVVAILCLSTAAAAQDYKAAAGSVPVPPEISAPVRALLSPASISVTGPSGPLCELWLRAGIPAAAQPATALGVVYGQLVDGSIVGAIHFDAAVKDFRSQTIQPGTYILRYALQPVDGNHQGVSSYRDFLLLTPAAADTAAANLADNDLYALSRKASAAGHPSVWSLVPIDSAPTLLPGVAHDTSDDFWVLYVKAAIGPSPATLGLVIVGHAPEQ